MMLVVKMLKVYPGYDYWSDVDIIYATIRL
jgi:hypothetical protein